MRNDRTTISNASVDIRCVMAGRGVERAVPEQLQIGLTVKSQKPPAEEHSVSLTAEVQGSTGVGSIPPWATNRARAARSLPKLIAPTVASCMQSTRLSNQRNIDRLVIGKGRASLGGEITYRSRDKVDRSQMK